MKKFHQKRRAFTIVELVIAIAVIAILAAILIPTFVNVAKNARLSADQQSVYDMNLALAVDEAENGAQDNVFSMMQHMDEEGYNFQNYHTLSANYQFFWDKQTNRIVLVSFNEETPSIAYPEEYMGTVTADQLVMEANAEGTVELTETSRYFALDLNNSGVTATTGSAYYSSLTSALKNVQDGETITLYNDANAIENDNCYLKLRENSIDELINHVKSVLTEGLKSGDIASISTTVEVNYNEKEGETSYYIIAKDNVTFDLNGHTLFVSNTNTYGLTIYGDNVTVKNGIVTMGACAHQSGGEAFKNLESLRVEDANGSSNDDIVAAIKKVVPTASSRQIMEAIMSVCTVSSSLSGSPIGVFMAQNVTLENLTVEGHDSNGAVGIWISSSVKPSGLAGFGLTVASLKYSTSYSSPVGRNYVRETSVTIKNCTIYSHVRVSGDSVTSNDVTSNYFSSCTMIDSEISYGSSTGIAGGFTLGSLYNLTVTNTIINGELTNGTAPNGVS